MSNKTQQRIYDLLQAMSKQGLNAAKQLFWTELNYDRANEPLSTRSWPERAAQALSKPPTILAQHSSQFGSFSIIYGQLSPEQEGKDFPLSLTAERLVVDQLLPHHPYSLFVFSDPQQQHWHLLNVKLERVADEDDGAETTAVAAPVHRRVFRRIAIGPHERLRTAAERVAMLDLATLSPDLSGLSPLAIQQRHDEAFDVEAVTKDFFQRFARLFYQVRDEIAAGPALAGEPDTLAQLLLDRLLFLYFIQKKGWLDQDPNYVYNRFLNGHAGQPQDTSYYGEVVYPLFLALSERGANQDLTPTVGHVPFLNGGLFELSISSGGRQAVQARLPVSNATFGALFQDLLEHYNFTITEDSPLDQEVAVDPEMLGKIFESVVLEREKDRDVDLRKATGSYYTPRPVVAFMCREALSTHLAGESGIDRERIAALFDLPPAEQLTDAERTHLSGSISQAEAETLKRLLLDVRACDPAVGSGAFLLGLLQATTSVASLLDWRMEGDAALDRRNYFYDLKKAVIEHCLYGVDIQAQAVRLCELRLWLSLIVDYELPEGVPFAGAVQQVPALPNLAYNVRQGDSLLERLFGQVVQLDRLTQDRESLELIEDLQQEKAAYYTLDDTAEKRRRELHILELQTALAQKLVQAQGKRLGGQQSSFLTQETARERRERQAWEARREEYRELQARVEAARKQLARWRKDADSRGLSGEELRQQMLGDPDHPTFLWRLDFAEVFQEKGGFDVMVANPPYVRMEKIKHLKSDLKQVYPQVYGGRADLYVYFYAQSLRQLRENGVLAYISSNKFMRAAYGKPLRQLLGKETTLDTVIDFGDLPVFEATTYPTVLVLRKQAPSHSHTLQALTVDEIGVISHLPQVVQQQAWSQRQDSLAWEGWALVRPEVLALLEKLRRTGTPLGKYVGGAFYRGIVTGYNKAFVIDQATRDRLIAEDPCSAEIIRPWLRGRDVKRWRVEWGGLYVIFALHGIDIKRYPAIKTYLEPFRTRLEKRATSAHHAWYELQQPQMGIYAEFEKPKIVWPDISKQCEFTFDDHSLYPDCTLFIVPESDFYLVGVLNSNVVDWFYRHVSPTIQQGFLRFKRIYLSQIPIPTPPTDIQASIETLVQQLLDADGKGPQVSEWEQQLNGLIYQVYGLTEEEIAIIEGGL